MQSFKLKHFRASHLMQLRNQEVKATYDEILKIFEDEEITIEYVKTALDDAKAESEKLLFLRNMNRKHHLTKTITELKHSRFDYFSVFTSTVRTSLKSPFEEDRVAAKVLDEWLEPYKKFLTRPLLRVQTTVAEEMDDEVIKVSRIAEAMDSLDLTAVFISIKSTTEELKTNINTRVKEMAAARRKAQELKRSAYVKMLIFLNSIEMVLNLNGENKPVYLRYAKEINEHLDNYKSLILSRSTRFKNAAEKEEMESGKGDNAEGTIDPTSTTPESRVAMGGSPYNVLSLDNGMDKEMQNMEKTNEDSTTASDALNGNATNDNSSNMANANDAATSNDELSDKFKGVSPANSNTSTHNGSSKFD